MRLRQFTPRQPIPHTEITPHEWKPDPEVIIKPGGLFARAWDCDYEKSILDSDYTSLVTPIHPKTQYDLNDQLMK